MDKLLQHRLHGLSDLDLAILVSLISGQHCIFYSVPNLAKDVRDELHLSFSETFGLQTAVVDCSRTTVDEFSEAILVANDDDFGPVPVHRGSARSPGLSAGLPSSLAHSAARVESANNTLDDRRIADVVIAMHLDLAGSSVQAQALELIRTKRIFTRTAMHTASKDFLFIVVASKPNARLSHHLNDMFGMSYFHEEEDGFPHVEGTMETHATPIFTRDEIKDLHCQADEARLTSEVDAYLHNVVVFMRQSRYVKGGVTATATRHLRAVAKALAPLHGLDYVPPALVTLAVRKVYPHRLILATAQTERTLQWGSDPAAVNEMLRGVTVEDVLEDVIGSVDTPL
ncbi:hypothetical protein LTR91_017108 [Friedmanniomyces endolithicus]|uniref:magnesium chelatase n=1 Tax=Friedmanniomyces endolithicus TaxID=329885 RepID=A0AAN6K6R6_9PEZI|nr:hypothetical protein LTR35_003686 [Friedmanniomyces endolithicus]KAK0289839.1 hypothetical protein LTS00_008976 [Friedmanniomyces endolithicus]KAK0326188.1 hypothetical protein LTR82_002933 [Friedmanniomyces endolithicus]KAK0910433.1 hypothetical protein LTR57_015874 [Friedmanniomyces endolithicus]KAK0967511.1 hypothetical protein LTR91_017108 [Friedmanniomyces endolithicus]